VLVGRLILEYNLTAVAQMIGKKPNAVKTLQFRALQSLQRILGKQRWPTCVQQGHKEEIR
jgi:RNA polymerase sigma-70 factor, ECF subfamily